MTGTMVIQYTFTKNALKTTALIELLHSIPMIYPLFKSTLVVVAIATYLASFVLRLIVLPVAFVKRAIIFHQNTFTFFYLIIQQTFPKVASTIFHHKLLRHPWSQGCFKPIRLKSVVT